MSMKAMLETEIEEEFNKLENLTPGSKEHVAAVDSLTKLMDRSIELEKLESSEAQTEKQMKADYRARLVKNLIEIGGIILPLAVTIWGAKASFKFEETGTITSQAGRQFMGKLFRSK